MLAIAEGHGVGVHSMSPINTNRRGGIIMSNIILEWFSHLAERSLPVFRHADNAVFFWNYHCCAHNLLESLDFAQQARLPSLRLRLNFSRHELVVRKPPSTVLAPRNITHDGPTSEPRLLASCHGGSAVL